MPALLACAPIALAGCSELIPVLDLMKQAQANLPAAPSGPVVLDVAETGSGYFAVQLASGLAYTRCGALSESASGDLTIHGHDLVPPIAIPSPATSLSAQPDGQILSGQASPSSSLPVGQLDVFLFLPGASQSAIGEGFFRFSGQPVQTVPGANGAGTLTKTDSAC